MNRQELVEYIRHTRSLHPITNCYSLSVIQKAEIIWEYDESLVFSYLDHGVNRLVYFARDHQTLDWLLSQIEFGKYYLEFITKTPNDWIPKGTELTARLMKMVNANCAKVFVDLPVKEFRNDSMGEYAREEDAAEINELLWKTFRTEVSHLLSCEELIDKIQKGKITIHRDNEIDALLQVDVLPQKFYINQIINNSDRSVIHAMLLHRLWDYAQNGGKYMYAWVEDSNIASLRFHSKYGMEHDGTWNVICCLEK